jgi:putative ABC transport system permease protein
MNLFQLLFKQMRQRALGTTLTMLSVVLGVGLATSIMLLYHAGDTLFGQSDYGYDVLVGIKGSPITLTLNTIYQLEASQGLISRSVYELLQTKYRSYVKIAVPYTVGDTYKGVYRIIGTMPKLFGFDDQTGQPLPPERVLEYRPGLSYQIAQGRVFGADKFEAVIGSEVASKTGLKIGDTFQATHGTATGGPAEVHKQHWTVVGILAPTHTASDRVLFIGMTSFYTVTAHGFGLWAAYKTAHPDAVLPPEPTGDEPDYALDSNGNIHLALPRQMLAISAVLVKSRGGVTGADLIYAVNNGGVGAEAMAINPASTMRDFFSTFFAPTRTVLLIIALLVNLVAAMGILVSIYNSVSARMREIAILRALGATRQRVLVLICAEAVFIGLVGGLLGLLLGHLMSAIASAIMVQTLGQSFDWWTVGADQLIYWAVVVVIALLAGLVPALKAYSVPVATNLVVT